MASNITSTESRSSSFTGDSHDTRFTTRTAIAATMRREAAPSQNRYKKTAYRNNKLGLKGVSARGRAYQAKITARGRDYPLGSFDSAVEAAAAYRRAARRLHGAFAGSG
jgi:hypothetical protein